MARFNFEAEREKNRRRSVDFNDPLRFVRDVEGGLSLKETAEHQLEMAERNRHLLEVALEAEKRRKAAEQAVMEADDLIMESVNKWSERRRQSVAEELLTRRHSLGHGQRDVESEISNLPSSKHLGPSQSLPIPEEEQEPLASPISSSLIPIVQLTETVEQATLVEAVDNKLTTTRNEFRRSISVYNHRDDSTMPSPSAPPPKYLQSRRASSFIPSSDIHGLTEKNVFHAKLSSASFNGEADRQRHHVTRTTRYIHNMQRSSHNSAKDSGYGGEPDEPFV